MADIATTLAAALDRAVDSVIDDVARDGLVTLRRVLNEAGFTGSEYLKNYEVYAHVADRSITFEIVLDFEAVLPEDEDTRKALEQEAERAEQEAVKTFGLTAEGPRRVMSLSNAKRDARRPARDARRPARRAVRGSRDRLISKEVANIRPRSIKVTRAGRLSVSLRRSAKESERGLELPRARFQGLIGKFMEELKQVISSAFVPELADIVRSYGVG